MTEKWLKGILTTGEGIKFCYSPKINSFNIEVFWALTYLLAFQRSKVPLKHQ
jgi:hypothetical protein